MIHVKLVGRLKVILIFDIRLSQKIFLGERCIDCEVNFCEACGKDSKKCSKCKNGYYLHNNFSKCVDCQGAGKYIESNLFCKDCSKNCSICSNETVCEKCEEQYFLKEKSCSKCEGLSYAWSEKEG